MPTEPPVLHTAAEKDEAIRVGALRIVWETRERPEEFRYGVF